MNNDIINIIGFSICAVLIYAWIESSLIKNKKRTDKNKEHELALALAKKELAIAIKKRKESKGN